MRRIGSGWRVPFSHPFVERLIGTVLREFLDHVLFWNARDLERKLADFRCTTTRHAPTRHWTAARRRPSPVDTRWPPLICTMSVGSHCRDPVQLPSRCLTANSRRTGESIVNFTVLTHVGYLGEPSSWSEAAVAARRDTSWAWCAQHSRTAA